MPTSTSHLERNLILVDKPNIPCLKSLINLQSTNYSYTYVHQATPKLTRAFINDESSSHKVPKEVLTSEITTLMYRHIVWLHAVKHSMRPRTLDFSSFEKDAARYLSKEEMAGIKTKKNLGTQLLDKQTQHLTELKRRGLIDVFRYMELQKMITDLFTEQGRTERIKNTPLPRQYSTSSAVFIVIFTLLLPFGMLAEFEN